MVLTGPLLGALADRSGFRKRFFIAFTLLCIVCIALFTTLQPGMILQGFALIVLANFGFESVAALGAFFLAGLILLQRVRPASRPT